MTSMVNSLTLTVTKVSPTVAPIAGSVTNVQWNVAAPDFCTAVDKTKFTVSGGTLLQNDYLNGVFTVYAAPTQDNTEHDVTLSIDVGACDKGADTNTAVQDSFNVDLTPPDILQIVKDNPTSLYVSPAFTLLSWFLEFTEICASVDVAKIKPSGSALAGVTYLRSVTRTRMLIKVSPFFGEGDRIISIRAEAGACVDFVGFTSASWDPPIDLLYYYDETVPTLLSDSMENLRLYADLTPAPRDLPPPTDGNGLNVAIRVRMSEACANDVTTAATLPLTLKDGSTSATLTSVTVVGTSTYIYHWSLLIHHGDFTWSLTIPKGYCSDLAGNVNNAYGPTVLWFYDETAPVPSFTLPFHDTSRGHFRTRTPVQHWKLTWSEGCKSFHPWLMAITTIPADSAQVVWNKTDVTNGRVEFVLDVTQGIGDVEITITMQRDVCIDPVGNRMGSTYIKKGWYDVTGPTVTFGQSPGTVFTTTYDLSVIIDETVRETAEDLVRGMQIGGSAAGRVASTTSYNANTGWSGVMEFGGTNALSFANHIQDIVIPRGTFHDLAGNVNEDTTFQMEYQPKPFILSSSPGHLMGGVAVDAPVHLQFNVPLTANWPTLPEITTLMDGNTVSGDYNSRLSLVADANSQMSILQLAAPSGGWTDGSTYKITFAGDLVLSTSGEAPTARQSGNLYVLEFTVGGVTYESTPMVMVLQMDHRFYNELQLCEGLQMAQRALVWPAYLSCDQIVITKLQLGSVVVTWKLSLMRSPTDVTTIQTDLAARAVAGGLDTYFEARGAGPIGAGSSFIADSEPLYALQVRNQPDSCGGPTMLTLTVTSSPSVTVLDQMSTYGARIAIRFPDVCGFTVGHTGCTESSAWVADVSKLAITMRIGTLSANNAGTTIDTSAAYFSWNSADHTVFVTLPPTATDFTFGNGETMEVVFTDGITMPQSCVGLNGWFWTIKYLQQTSGAYDAVATRTVKAYIVANPEGDSCKGEQVHIFGDPHFKSFSGGEYDVTGRVGYIYNIITDKHFQWNAKFVSLTSRATMYSYLGHTAFLINGTRLEYNPQTDEAAVDGAVMVADETKRVPLGKTLYFAKKLKGMLVLRVPGFRIALKRVTKDHGKWLPHFDQVVDLVNDDPGLVHPHGLLGQTVHFDSPVNPLDKQGGGVIAGQLSDYEVPTLWSTEFPYNQYGDADTRPVVVVPKQTQVGIDREWIEWVAHGSVVRNAHGHITTNDEEVFFRTVDGVDLGMEYNIGTTVNVLTDKRVTCNAKMTGPRGAHGASRFVGEVVLHVDSVTIRYGATGAPAPLGQPVPMTLTVNGTVAPLDQRVHLTSDGKYYVLQLQGGVVANIPGYVILWRRVERTHSKKALLHLSQRVVLGDDVHERGSPTGLVGDSATISGSQVDLPLRVHQGDGFLRQPTVQYVVQGGH